MNLKSIRKSAFHFDKKLYKDLEPIFILNQLGHLNQ